LLADGMPAAAGKLGTFGVSRSQLKSDIFISFAWEGVDVRVAAQRDLGAMSDLINALHREY
jgi:hypothetical protein